MNDSTSMFSAHALPNRAARRFALSRRRQRKAQALILAVLVMLMVAVLSAGFLLVVSGNLNQTARVTDKTRAVESARSGLKFVNEQLTYSQLGENWRPGFVAVNRNNLTAPEKLQLAQGESIMPQMNDGIGDYSLYYSQVDIANDWAGRFAKFPDPLAPRSDAPQYLARVQRIPSELDAGDPDATDATKQGMLKITLIGLSNDDPAAFSKVVAYKGGQSSPFGRFMRTVTNWDFKNNVVPNATVASYDSGTLKLTLNNVQGVFPTQGQATTAPFTVMIGNASVAQPLRGAVVQNVSTDGTVLTLAAAPATPLVGERVELAAQIGASKPLLSASSTDPNKNSTAVDFNLDGTVDTTNEKTNLSISAANTPGSVFVSGSALLVGDVKSLLLEGRSDATHIPSNVEASGLIAQDSTVTSPVVTVEGIGSQTGTPFSKSLVATSNAANFPLGAAGDADDNSLVADGFARVAGSGGSLRQIAPAPAPDISSGASAERYRRLAREDNTLVNNSSDREKVWDATTDPTHAKLRDMTQAELVQMWLSRTANNTEDTTARFCRASSTTTTPAVATATDTKASLEEQHLRGWVGPDEFHPRGALIELISEAKDPTQAVSALNPLVAKVAITLDSRSDNDAVNNISTNASGDVGAKAWKNMDGTPATGVYRKVFNWPANGVIFAEGNARVRGEIDYNLPTATGAVHSSLTIVSQNNIYIDGSVDVERNRPASPPANTPTPKLLLLARKNVVANPTQAVYRPDVQSNAQADATAPLPASLATTGPQPVKVADISDFRKGDVVETTTVGSPTAINTVSLVQGVTLGTPTQGTTPGTLSLLALFPGTVNNGDIVRTRQEATASSRAIIGGAPAGATIVGTDPQFNAIQRRLQVSTDVDGVSTATLPNLRLAFDHSASKVPIFTVGVDTNAPNPVFWSMKQATDTSGIALPSDKAAKGFYTPTVTATSAPDDTFGNSATATIDSVIGSAGASGTILGTPHGMIPNVWNYTSSSTPPVPNYGSAPFYYLASKGNRELFGKTVPASPTSVVNRRANLKTAGYEMLLATTVTARLNGAPVALAGFETPAFAPVRYPLQFGFSPNYSVTGSDPAIEDALTADDVFYQPLNAINIASATTLDSRSLQDPTTPAGSIVTQGTQIFSLYQPTGLTNVGTATAPLPQYRLGHMKMERIDPTNGNVTPGYTMNINAFVYAQTGSWFVIPNVLFNPKDFTSDAAGNNTIFNNTVPDLNRNGQAGIGKRDAQLRYARANYRVNFFGAIAENQTAIVNPVGTVPGAVQAWSNDWATYNYTADAGTDPTVKPALTNSTPGVVYTFDPSYAAGQLTNDTGFVMPQSEELTYVE